MATPFTPPTIATSEIRTRYIGIDLPLNGVSLTVERQRVDYDANAGVIAEHPVVRRTVGTTVLMGWLAENKPNLYADIRDSIDQMEADGVFVVQ